MTDVQDQNSVATTVALNPDGEMLEAPAPVAPTPIPVDEKLVTRDEFNQLGEAVMALNSQFSDALVAMAGKQDMINSEISALKLASRDSASTDLTDIEALEEKLATIVTHNRLKMPPIKGNRTKFAPPRAQSNG